MTKVIFLQIEGYKQRSQAKEHLHSTAREGDGLFFWEEAHQHRGNGDSGVADVQEGEVPQEEVHRGVKVGV